MSKSRKAIYASNATTAKSPHHYNTYVSLASIATLTRIMFTSISS